MMDYEKRDSEILKLMGEGVSSQEISRRFDISRDRIRQIIKKSVIENERKNRVEEIRQAFKSANDIEKKWPRDVIMDGLVFPKKVTWRLIRYFNKEDIHELSLKDLMDFLIIDYKRLPGTPREVIPAYRENQIGIIAHAILVHHLTQQDLGEAFNTEWVNRLDKLMRYFRISMRYVPKLLRRYTGSYGL